MKGGGGVEIRVLKYFLAAAREENISRAAETLHITQPTLSRQISQLEEELGIKLFERGKHLTLTEEGALLRRRAEEVTELVDKIESDFSAPSEISGRISIGEGALAASEILMRTMIRFREKWPGVQYEIYSNTSDYIKEQLDKGLCDFGLLLEPIDIEKYEFIRLPVKERWGISMMKEHPLAAKPYITKEELQDLPLITPSRLSMQKEITSWLGEKIDYLNIFATSNLITNAHIMTDLGQICFMSVEGAVDHMQSEKMVFRPLYPALELSSVLVWKRFQPLPAATAKFLEEFRDMLSEYKDV